MPATLGGAAVKRNPDVGNGRHADHVLHDRDTRAQQNGVDRPVALEVSSVFTDRYFAVGSCHSMTAPCSRRALVKAPVSTSWTEIRASMAILAATPAA
jgi:hypothetical protein